MNIDTINEVIACLSKERTLFHYYKDRYSIGLLQQYVAKKPAKISELKQSALAKLTEKPRVKNVLANLGKQPLDQAFLKMHDYDEAQQAYTLSLSHWGSDKGDWRYEQVSRRGYNLVLQLNFNQQHDKLYQQLGADEDGFNFYGHPVSRTKNTLAWARLDFDWESNAALIEEVQSDWLRRVIWLKKRCLQRLASNGGSQRDKTHFFGIQVSLNQTIAYCDYVLAQYQSTWAESMLWAAIQFLWHEIGIHEIFYHTELSGKRLKNIESGAKSDEERKGLCFSKVIFI